MSSCFKTIQYVHHSNSVQKWVLDATFQWHSWWSLGLGHSNCVARTVGPFLGLSLSVFLINVTSDTLCWPYSPEKIAEKPKITGAARAWKASRFGHMGASAMETLSNRKQSDSSSMPLTRSNSGPINNVPTTEATPIQMNVVDICSVLVDVQTSMSGNDVAIVLKLIAYNFNDTTIRIASTSIWKNSDTQYD